MELRVSINLTPLPIRTSQMVSVCYKINCLDLTIVFLCLPQFILLVDNLSSSLLVCCLRCVPLFQKEYGIYFHKCSYVREVISAYSILAINRTIGLFRLTKLPRLPQGHHFQCQTNLLKVV